eukprot:m.215220 g.215220  ORF g.215220 m.215220 type:complete len:114 (+) comp15105_c1_seq37:4902-5243(+)
MSACKQGRHNEFTCKARGTVAWLYVCTTPCMQCFNNCDHVCTQCCQEHSTTTSPLFCFCRTLSLHETLFPCALPATKYPVEKYPEIVQRDLSPPQTDPTSRPGRVKMKARDGL